MRRSTERFVQLPSLLMIIFCYTAWVAATGVLAAWSVIPALIVLPFIIAFHSSLQHEAIHGHIFKSPFLRYVTVFPALGMFIPYERFRETHLYHHTDINLTDPYDDPESNFMSPQKWQSLSGGYRALYNFNNTLIGRIMIGPAISLWRFYSGDIKAILRGNGRILKAYVMHGAGVAVVALWLDVFSALPVWAYPAACYFGMGILKIRTFLEHRAHDNIDGRTVIIEDNGLLAFIFLNNNLHALHHEQPHFAWFELPHAYRAKRDDILKKNDHYIFKNYNQVFRAFFLKRKDPVSHPLR